MQWSKTAIPFRANGSDYHNTYTAYNANEMYQVIDAGNGESEVFYKEEVCHWVIGICVGQNSKGAILREPNYRQKVMILEEIGKWKKIALEVMPPEMEVVDREDVYHMWEFEYPYSFRYGYTPIFEEPEMFEKEIDGVQYHVRTEQRVKYIYLRSCDGKELTWRKKQKLKNEITSPIDTAVEIISQEMLGKGYTCLVCLPRFEFLDFGLT